MSCINIWYFNITHLEGMKKPLDFALLFYYYTMQPTRESLFLYIVYRAAHAIQSSSQNPLTVLAISDTGYSMPFHACLE